MNVPKHFANRRQAQGGCGYRAWAITGVWCVGAVAATMLAMNTRSANAGKTKEEADSLTRIVHARVSLLLSHHLRSV